MALARDCAVADIVISDLYITRETCPGPLLLDRAALRNNGAYALYFRVNGAVEVETVHAQRGDRPWTGLKPERF